MTICTECGQTYKRDTGPMICVCDECLNESVKLEPYIKQGNFYIPNPERKVV